MVDGGGARPGTREHGGTHDRKCLARVKRQHDLFNDPRPHPSTRILPPGASKGHHQSTKDNLDQQTFRTNPSSASSLITMTMIRRRRCCLPTMSMAVVCLLAAVMMMSSMGSSYGQESDIYNDEEGYGYGNDNEDMYAGQDYGGDSYQDYNNNNAADSYYSQQQTQDLQQQEQQDNLYADYAARQEMKELGGGGG